MKTSIAPPSQQCQTALRQIAEALRQRDNFLICSHVRPDGDCIGSTLALMIALEGMGKRVAAYNPTRVPDNLMFLPQAHRISDHLHNGFQPNVTIFVDCGSPDRVDEGFKPVGYVINIDHHATNDVFGDLNYIDVKATAVGEQIYNLLDVLDIQITPDIASNLLLSIVADTGGFRYPNTNARTFHVAAHLVEAGAVASRIAQEFYETRSRESIRLQGETLSKLHFDCGGALAWGEIRWAQYVAVGGVDHEPEGLVSDIRGIKGVEVSLLIHELEEGGLRVGLRSKGKVNVSTLARKLGGGGHHNASGAYIRGDYDELMRRVLDESRRHVAEALGIPYAAPTA